MRLICAIILCLLVLTELVFWVAVLVAKLRGKDTSEYTKPPAYRMKPRWKGKWTL